MQRIIISESDLTSNVEVTSSYDVAYVPGFMNSNTDDINQYYRKPTLFTNKYDFVNKIKGVPKFRETQEYPKFVSGVSDGFTSRAIPDSNIMFAEGDSDLGYRIALYLLNLGMPVYYEVMNTTNANVEGATYYNYTKIDKTQTVFDSNVTYYVLKQEKSNETSVYASAGDFAPLPELLNDSDAKQTFINAVGADNDGDYVFSGVREDDSEDSDVEGDVRVTWTLGETTVNLADYGISVSTEAITNFIPGETYTFTMTYESASADEITQKNIGPDEADSWFRHATDPNGENVISAFDENTTYYTLSENEIRPITVESMYLGLKHRFIDTPAAADVTFDSVGDYSVKYITSGGYPTFEYCFKGQTEGFSYPLMTGMIDCAYNRGDSVALIDHTNNPNRDLYPSTLGGSGNAVIDIVRNMGTNIHHGDFGAMFTPWFECSHGAISTDSMSAFVPGSVGYLSALATQIRDYNPWLAVSGVTRGRVPNLVTASSDTLHTVSLLTNNIADSYQTLPSDGGVQISINPITYIRNVGYCLWGNRTLRNNNVGTSALSFLNIRNSVSDVKKTIYEACQANLFEQNTDITWINFTDAITPVLDKMVSGYILQDYSVTRYMVDPSTGNPVPAYKVVAVIRIQPINSIEVFDLTVQLENAEVVVEEVTE